MTKDKRFFAFDTETKQGGAFISSIYGGGKAATYKIKSKEDVTKFLELMLSKKFGSIGFAYNLDYDVIALLKWYGDLTIMALYLNKECDVEGLKIGYIPKKFLYIQRGKQITYIFELMQYFNMSLDKAGDKYVGRRKAELLNEPIRNYLFQYFQKSKKKVLKKDITEKDVKQNIYLVYTKFPKRIIDYCEQDARLTCQLAQKLESMILAFGMSIQKYYSCGYIAKSYLKAKNIRFQPLRDEEIINIIKPSYFGGRIEFTQRGYFNDAYQYDINSAYPFACMQLENIIDMRMKQSIDKNAKYFFVDCDIMIRNRMLSPLAYRANNLIIYPSGKIRQRVDNFTFDTLMKEGSIVKIHNCFNVYTDGNKPFEQMIKRLYKRRLNCSEDEKYIIKIILNSLYGKFAEKRKDYINVDEATAWEYMDRKAGGEKGCNVLETDIGYYIRKTQYSKFSNLIYASLITSYTRNYMYSVMKEIKSENVIGAMTDCIFSKVPLPKQYVSEDKAIGMFSLKEKSFCYVIGSGVYSSEGGNKLRGYNIKANLLELAKESRYKDTLTIASTERKGSGKLVVQGLDILNLNEITDTDKNLNLNFDTKRIWFNGGFSNFEESLTKSIRSKTIIL